jgi:hypothetical protein
LAIFTNLGTTPPRRVSKTELASFLLPHIGQRLVSYLGLTTIAAPPGRIYDKHKLTASPSGELTAAAKSAAEITGVTKPAN